MPYVRSKKYVKKTRKSNYRRKRVYRKSRAMLATVKRVVRSQVLEKREFEQASNIASVIHRDFYYMTPISPVPVALNDNARSASEVFVKGIRIKVMLNRVSTFYDDIKLRLVAFWQPPNEIDLSETQSATWVASNNLVKPIVYEHEGSGLESINTADYGIKPYYQRTVIDRARFSSSAVAKSAKCIDFYIPCGFKFKWRVTTGQTTIPIKQFFVSFYAYGGGLASTDLNALFSINSRYTVDFVDE